MWIKAMITFLVIVVIIVLDLLSTMFFVQFLGVSQLELYMDPLLWLMATFVSKTILFTGSYLVRHSHKNKNQVVAANRWVWLMILFIPAFTIFNLNISIEAVANTENAVIDVFINAIGLFYVNVILVFLLDKISREQNTMIENLWYKQEINNRMRENKMWTDALDKQRVIAHDVNHHFTVIYQLLGSNQLEEAKAYLGKLSNGTSDRQVVETNHPIINAVINQKYWKAREHGIGMVFKINNLAGFPIQSEELVTILANLLDNAIEANDQVEGQKNIVVKIMMEDEGAILSIRNTSNPVTINGNQIKTTKENRVEHGFGLKSITRCLDKYNFTYAMQYQEGWFNFTAIYTRVNV